VRGAASDQDRLAGRDLALLIAKLETQPARQHDPRLVVGSV
jgi:hypothetical protein